MEFDVIVVGAGLAGLTAAAEVADAGRSVLLLDQEPEASLGGQAWWSFGGLFLVDSPEQRRLGIRDSKELAWQDWQGTAGFDRLEDEDHWGRRWAEAYVDFAAGETRAWLHRMGVRFFPVVGWAERGGYLAEGHGNSVPRFHIVWGTGTGIVALGPSSLWLDATGKRFPAPNFPGFDTLGTLDAIQKTGYDYSWFILTQKIIEREFALSGSEQNPDLTGKSIRKVLSRVLPGPTPPVQAFMDKGEDFVVARELAELVAGMNKLAGQPLLSLADIERQIVARDREIEHSFTKDLQITAIRGARNYIGDKLIRVAKPHKMLDPKNGPLIAVRLRIVSRKTLGGLQTDLSGRVLNSEGAAIPGLYAAGEASGFGGGGLHGYRALEGTFLGGCLFTGRVAGRAIAAELR